jgi:hypothetical protein
LSPLRPAILAGAAAATGIAVGVGFQAHNPKRVDWELASLPGCHAQKAEGLVLQEERGSTVWATRGYDIYRSEEGEAFERVASVRPPLGEPWLGYLSSLRRAFGYQELVEVVPLRADLIIAFAGGAVFRIDLKHHTQERVLTLRYFGPGKGRGVLSRIAVDDQGRVFFGEYVNMKQPHTVRVWRGEDEGRRWVVAHEFAPGEVGHIHGLQWEDATHTLWLMTGDTDSESGIGFSTNGGETFAWLGHGEQRFRACSLLFMKDGLMWATDTDDNALMTWSRTTHQIRKVMDLPAQSLYAESLDATQGLVALSTWDAAALLVNEAGAVRKLAQFTPVQIEGQPFPGVRLAMGRPPSRNWIFVNPLRTLEEESAIYRVAASDLPRCEAPRASPQ